MRDEIAIVPSYRIDHEKWNRCIEKSHNGLIYASSAYLDHLADNWTGIILNDYEDVMPVPWRKKMGIKYCYHVPFIQQLGIFPGTNKDHENIFLKTLFSICKYGDYPFNFDNRIGETSTHTNFVLYLDEPYTAMMLGFSHDVLQNIRRSAGMDISYEEGQIDEAVYHFSRLYGNRTGVTGDQFRRFEKLCFFLREKGNLIVRKVANSSGAPLAIALLPKDNRRLYNLLNSTLPEGKTCEANYFLLSSLWKEFEQTGLIFDFEGSDIKGVHDFYKKFGGKDQEYYRLHFNHLPWPINLLKK